MPRVIILIKKKAMIKSQATKVKVATKRKVKPPHIKRGMIKVMMKNKINNTSRKTTLTRVKSVNINLVETTIMLAAIIIQRRMTIMEQTRVEVQELLKVAKKATRDLELMLRLGQELPLQRSYRSNLLIDSNFIRIEKTYSSHRCSASFEMFVSAFTWFHLLKL
jgi:hypothetical protein